VTLNQPPEPCVSAIAAEASLAVRSMYLVQQLAWTGAIIIMSLFTMRVEDTFHLEDGRPVFIGAVETEAASIPPCDCEIVVGDEVKASFRIDGEEFLKGKKTPDRSISTSQRMNLASDGIGRSGFIIRSKI
jgi:hypothetical protein